MRACICACDIGVNFKKNQKTTTQAVSSARAWLNTGCGPGVLACARVCARVGWGDRGPTPGRFCSPLPATHTHARTRRRRATAIEREAAPQAASAGASWRVRQCTVCERARERARAVSHITDGHARLSRTKRSGLRVPMVGTPTARASDDE